MLQGGARDGTMRTKRFLGVYEKPLRGTIHEKIRTRHRAERRLVGGHETPPGDSRENAYDAA